MYVTVHLQLFIISCVNVRFHAKRCSVSSYVAVCRTSTSNMVMHVHTQQLINSAKTFARAAKRGGATGAICPGSHSVGGPMLTNSTSIKQNTFSIHS